MSEKKDEKKKKKILYFDMDGVLVDFQSGIDRLSEEVKNEYRENIDEAPGIFGLMKPMPGAIEAVHKLKEHYDVYILSTAPWKKIDIPLHVTKLPAPDLPQVYNHAEQFFSVKNPLQHLKQPQSD